MAWIKYVGGLSSVLLDQNGLSNRQTGRDVRQRDVPFEIRDDVAARLVAQDGSPWVQVEPPPATDAPAPSPPAAPEPTPAPAAPAASAPARRQRSGSPATPPRSTP